MKDLFFSFIIAFSFLTAVPVPFLNKVKYSDKNVLRSVIFYPLTGLFYGFIIFLTAKYLFNIDKLLLTIIIVSIPPVLSKFLHLDGLLDVLDAFLSSKSKEERLVILKDPHIGSYAAGGALIFMLLKIALTDLIISDLSLINFFIIIPVLSRHSMVFLAYISVYPRKKGTAQFLVGKIKAGLFITVNLITVLILTVFVLINHHHADFLLLTVSAVCTVFMVSLLFKFYSYAKIGGVTGDVLGALNELIELCIPAVILAVNSGIKT